jgi:plasmid stabilization system protein ParE
MMFRVILLPRAVEDLDEAICYAAKRAPMTAARWLERFQQAIEGLAKSPLSWPLAHESKKAKLSLREMLFGRKPNVFRVVFEVVGNEVQVLRIRRGARRWLSKKDLERPNSGSGPSR